MLKWSLCSKSSDGAECLFLAIVVPIALFILALPVLEIIGDVQLMLGQPYEENVHVIGIWVFIGLAYMISLFVWCCNEEGKVLGIALILALLGIVLILPDIFLVETCPIITAISDIILTILSCFILVLAMATS